MTGRDEARNLIWDIATRLREAQSNMGTAIKRASGDEALLVCEQSWTDLGLALVSLEALDRLHQTPAGQDIGGPFVPENVR